MKKLILGVAVTSVSLTIPIYAVAQDPAKQFARMSFVSKMFQTESLRQSNAKAFGVVNRAVKAGGGTEKIMGVKGISFDYEGEVAATFQGLNPNNPHRYLPRTGSVSFDIAKSRIFNSSETKWPNFSSTSYSLYLEGKTHELNQSTKTYTSFDDNEILQTWESRLTPLLLRHLLQNSLSLRSEGQQRVAGQLFNVVSSTLTGKTVYRFYFSDSSGHLTIIEHLDYSSDFGDKTVRTVFSDFTTFQGLVIPIVMKSFNNDHLITSYGFKNILLDGQARLDRASLPEGYRLADNRPQESPRMQTREIASHVYLIENLAGRDYNVMFADLGDALMVFEAPIDIWASRIALEEIRKVFPNKPVRYVMVSHFHDDHAAGIRMYMAEGATVITTPGNQAYFERVARLTHNHHRENKNLVVSEPKFEIVKNKYHEIKSGNLTIQFIDLGPTAHVDENIVAYIPERNLLFQGDYFRVPVNRKEPEALRDEGMIFYQKITDKKLRVGQLIGTHGAIGDISDLEEAYQLRNKK